MQIVVDSYGAMLSQHNGMFELKLRKENIVKRIAPSKVSGIMLSRGVSLSSDVVLLAIEHDIDVVFVDRFGKPQGRIWANRFGSIATIRKRQVLFASHTQGGLWALGLVRRKLQAQLAFGQQLLYAGCIADTKAAERKLNIIQRIDLQLADSFEQGLPLGWQDSLRGWEGTAAKHYFQLLAMAVPPTYRFEGRTRPATDMFNCTLNYLYGILYSSVESALIKAGIDPFVGVFHADAYAKPVLTFDFIEPYRVWADTVLLRLCLAYSLSARHFSPADSGGIWLNTEGKKVIISPFQQFLEEIIPYREQRRSRQTQISLDAQSFAQLLLHFNPENP